MYRNVLVPLDGTSFGEHALPMALSVAKHCGAALKLVHVHVPMHAVYLEGAMFFDDTLESDIKTQHYAYLESVVQRLRETKRISNVTVELLDGEVGPTLSSYATANADLVVMTTHARGPIGRFWLGSVTTELIRDLPMPLLLMHPEAGKVELHKDPALHHILVPLDGTKLAERIIDNAIALGSIWNADYTLLRVIRPVMPVDYPSEVTTVAQMVQSVVDRIEKVQAQLRAEAHSYLEIIAAEMRKGGLRVCTRVDVEQQPAEAILHDARSPEFDAIAMETHGRRGLARLFRGSVADKVLRGATVPLLLRRGVETK